VEELNVAAARIAKEQVELSGRNVIVAGSMGPTGEILEPNGPVSIAQAREAFSEQAAALAKGGADVLWIEHQPEYAHLRGWNQLRSRCS